MKTICSRPLCDRHLSRCSVPLDAMSVSKSAITDDGNGRENETPHLDYLSAQSKMCPNPNENGRRRWFTIVRLSKHFSATIWHRANEKTLNNTLCCGENTKPNLPIKIDTALRNREDTMKNVDRCEVVVNGQIAGVLSSCDRCAYVFTKRHESPASNTPSIVDPDRSMSIAAASKSIQKWIRHGLASPTFDRIILKRCGGAWCGDAGEMAAHTKTKLSWRTHKPIDKHKFKYYT